MEKYISFISHGETIDSSKHLNGTKLHLNENGLKVFAENFLVFLKKFSLRQLKFRLPTFLSLNFKKESHAHETLE